MHADPFIRPEFPMHVDPFIAEFADLMDRKVALMRDLMHAMARATSSAEVAGALRAAATRFEGFSESVELPFEKAYGDRLGAPPAEVREHLARHQATIDDFIHTLQGLKYGATYQGDEPIRVAIAQFEFATATIPPHDPNRGN